MWNKKRTQGSLDDDAYSKEIESAHTLELATRRFLAESCEMAHCLPPEKKCLFVMRYSRGLSCDQIASLCKVTRQTVYNRLKQITRDLEQMRKSCKEMKNG
jgi:DNA-directed RNA polymerase specialized sigma24 family protein